MSQPILLNKTQLASFGLSPGDIYLSFKGRDVHLLKLGEWISNEWIEKYTRKGAGDFKVDSFVDLAKLDVFQSRWKAFYSSDEFEVMKANENWWSFVQSDSHSTLSWTLSSYKAFCQFDKKNCDELESNGAQLFNRSLVVATTGCILGIIMGFSYGKMLNDIYHLCLAMDSSLWTDGVRFETSSILEKERNTTGAGLKEMNSAEVELWKVHALETIKWLGQLQKKCLFEPDLASSIQIHHEKNDGSGLSLKRKKGSFSDLEVILILADYLVDRDIDWKKPMSPKEIMLKLEKIKMKNNLPIDRVQKYWRDVA